MAGGAITFSSSERAETSRAKGGGDQWGGEAIGLEYIHSQKLRKPGKDSSRPCREGGAYADGEYEKLLQQQGRCQDALGLTWAYVYEYERNRAV